MSNSSRTKDADGYFLAGFVEGEGSFNVSFKKTFDRNLTWRASICFNVSQRDPTVLFDLQKALGCGRIRDRGDGVHYFEVNKPKDLLRKVVPFFRRYPLRSPSKAETLDVFEKICRLMVEKAHLTRTGIEEILILRQSLNNETSKRRYEDQEILDTLQYR